MLRNLSETRIWGSNTIFLNVPENEFFYAYNGLTEEAAKEITKGFFHATGKRGTPSVKDISFDSSIHNIKITVEVDNNR